LQKVIRRVSENGRSVLNAAVAANIGETGEAGASSTQRVEIVQRNGRAARRLVPTDPAPNDKES
jgi:hypothetical protein